MTDQELLGLAAKAAGYTLQDHLEVSAAYYPWCVELDDCWNPLTDDDDAFRLAVKLNINVQHEADAYEMKESTNCGLYGEDAPEWCEEIKGNDPYAATRRAIVRAAAEIGRRMGCLTNHQKHYANQYAHDGAVEVHEVKRRVICKIEN